MYTGMCTSVCDVCMCLQACMICVIIIVYSVCLQVCLSCVPSLQMQEPGKMRGGQDKEQPQAAAAAGAAGLLPP